MNNTERKAILCVDDEAIILMHLVMILEQRYGSRFLFAKASNAEKGMDILAKLYAEGIRVIMIVSDWLMPGINGDAFIQLVHKTYPDIKAILISGKIDKNSLGENTVNTSFAGFLSKPIIAEDLYVLIDNILSDNKSM